MYLVEASICPQILRTGQAVLPLEPSPTHPVGLPSCGSSIQKVVAGRRGHGRRAGNTGASAGQGFLPVVDQLPKGAREAEGPPSSCSPLWAADLHSPRLPGARRAAPPPPSVPSPRQGAAPAQPHSLEDSALLQAILATIPHGCVVYGLDGPIDGLEDILLQALGGEGRGTETR